MTSFQIVKDSYNFSKNSLIQLIVYLSPPIALYTLLLGFVHPSETAFVGVSPYSTVISSGGETAILSIILRIISCLYNGLFILFVYNKSVSKELSYKKLYSPAFKLLIPLFILDLIVNAAANAGFLILVIPGIWISLRLSYSYIFLIVKEVSPLEAVKLSFSFTKDKMKILSQSVLMFVIPYILALILLSSIVLSNQLTDRFFWAIFTIDFLVFPFVNIILIRIFLLSASYNTEK
ncbi:MAG: hypothetical protein OCD00_20220 [Colwellia sp.]